MSIYTHRGYVISCASYEDLMFGSDEEDDDDETSFSMGKVQQFVNFLLGVLV